MALKMCQVLRICLFLLAFAFRESTSAPASKAEAFEDSFFRSHSWVPKIQGQQSCDSYDPNKVDWYSVRTACRQVGVVEKRLLSFLVRASFHDAMAVKSITDCEKGCGGPDGSLVLTEDELERTENVNPAAEIGGWAKVASEVLKKIVAFYGCSYADAIAVCGAEAVEFFGGAPIFQPTYDDGIPFKVGRCDSIEPGPEVLPLATINILKFRDFFEDRGFTLREAVALEGSHNLVAKQACLTNGARDDDQCDPFSSEDSDSSREHRCPIGQLMFQWKNQFFENLCTPSNVQLLKKPQIDPEVEDMTEKQYKALQRDTACTFTGKGLRDRALEYLESERSGKVSSNPVRRGIEWGRDKHCVSRIEDEELPDALKDICDHTETWPYTVFDGYLAMACQGQTPPSGKNKTSKQEKKDLESLAADLKPILREFLDKEIWEKAYGSAYKKMVNNLVSFSPHTDGDGLIIYGNECSRDGQNGDCQYKMIQNQYRVSCNCPTAVNFRTGVARKRSPSLVVEQLDRRSLSSP